ncbi:MAG: hypothetical protein ACOY3P_02965 [Planctomycetota bacterium]
MTRWKRAKRRRACPVCGKPDWCLYTGPADHPEAVICARIESPKRCGEAGWLHKLRESFTDDWRTLEKTVTLERRAEPIHEDISKTIHEAQDHVGRHPELLNQLAKRLGLTAQSLRRLGVGYLPKRGCHLFPMRDAAGALTGARLRYPDGAKLSLRGGREGLFYADDLAPDDAGLLAVTEGPSDCAALLDLGFQAIGRPSCRGGLKHLVALVRRLRPKCVAIVADNDLVGVMGAAEAAGALAVVCADVRIIFPPYRLKDARAWKQAGATRDDLLAAIKAAPQAKADFLVQEMAGGKA